MLAPQPFAVRMTGNERLELGDQLGVTAEGEVGGDPLLERRELELLEPRALGLRERRLAEIRERRPAPERERLAQRLGRGGGCLASRPFDELREALEVELAGLDAEEVARPAGDDSVGAEQLAERVHRHLEGVCGRLRRILAPEGVDQALARNDRVGVEEQKREQRPLAPAADGEDAAVLLDLERAEQPELDACAASFLHRSKRAVSGP